MPEIKLQYVVSCSSEDKNHPADNILKPEGTHKWKCASAGEKSASVVLQFEKATEIHSVDIGNEGSAFVEILVGKSTAASDKDYQVLLVASTFMTPIEARNGTNKNSVRMFDSSKLSAPVLGQKWDRVKIVCTQPFSKTSAFGLSFIKFHGPGGTVTEKKETGAGEKLGFFKIKTEESTDVKPGNLFSHRGKETVATPPPLSGAAAMRAASRLADNSRLSTSPDTKPATPKIKEEKSTPKTEKKAPTPSQNREKRKHNVSDDDDGDTDEDVPKPALRKQSTSLSSVSSKDSGKNIKPPPLKKTKSEPPKDSPVKEFRKLMDKVVFVMSGYQNPYRAELRDRAVAMGATYKPDWGKGCTHLICAFVNTPKYNQVSGKGRIVDKKWINDCYKQKKLLPWRDYRIGDAESPDEDSDEDITPVKHKETSTPKAAKKPSPVKTHSVVPMAVDDDDDDLYGGNTDSGEDTDEEIRKIKEKQVKKDTDKSPQKLVKTEINDDPYDVDTDEDEKPGPSGVTGADSDDSGLPELPDFFAEKYFFIYGDMETVLRRSMIRYITAYAGELEEYMSDKVKYVVTSSKWDNNFDVAISDNPNLAFVKPRWVQVCHEKSKLVPHQPYVVVPDS